MLISMHWKMKKIWEESKKLTKVDKGKQVVFDKMFVFRGTCFKCGKDKH